MGIHGHVHSKPGVRPRDRQVGEGRAHEEDVRLRGRRPRRAPHPLRAQGFQGRPQDGAPPRLLASPLNQKIQEIKLIGTLLANSIRGHVHIKPGVRPRDRQVGEGCAQEEEVWLCGRCPHGGPHQL